MFSGIVDREQGIETRGRLIFFVFLDSEFIMSSKTGQLSGKIKLISIAYVEKELKLVNQLEKETYTNF